jgi:hypothetical protein
MYKPITKRVCFMYVNDLIEILKIRLYVHWLTNRVSVTVAGKKRESAARAKEGMSFPPLKADSLLRDNVTYNHLAFSEAQHG